MSESELKSFINFDYLYAKAQFKKIKKKKNKNFKRNKE